MKLLLDANLSWRLTVKLKSHFEDCLHVDQIGLHIPVSDTGIWNYALMNQLIIVTNDDDFLNFANVKGFPPKVILLRTGNQSNQYIEALLVNIKLIFNHWQIQRITGSSKFFKNYFYCLIN